jgi:exodeoxyribonuclease V alpha subunit
MQTFSDVHRQFAALFDSPNLKPYAYLVSKKLSEGHICLPLDELAIEDLPEIWKKSIPDPRGLQDEKLVATASGRQPFILHNKRLYLHRYFNYETILLNRIKTFAASDLAQREERIQLLNKHQKDIESIFPINGQQITDWQAVAGIMAALNDFTIITGGPGTGKTTTVARILALLHLLQPGLKVALAAPTGKAATRMAESLKNAGTSADNAQSAWFASLEPSTIQRLLGYIPGSPYFRHDNKNPLPVDVIIVDECSMLDAALFAKLLDATAEGTRLILLGDKDQLASVEAGSLFGDLCNAIAPLNNFSSQTAGFINNFIQNHSRKIPAENILKNSNHPLFEHIIALQHSHRYNAEKGIGKFSKAVIKYDHEGINTFLKNGDEQVCIDVNYSDAFFNRFIQGYESYIGEADIRIALQKLGSLRVLCAVREGPHGLYSTNQKIENYLVKKGLLKTNTLFYENRPVIITKNYYDLGLFNGDIGIIRPDIKDPNIMRAWFVNGEGALKWYPCSYLDHSETVFAMTIHKSQGSEFDQVMIVLPSATGTQLLTRELLYTAVTRAKSKVYIQATNEVIFQSAEAFVKRSSGITDRFLENF